ncbi:MAG: glycosyltransferase [Syntrophobacteraceae bacterium]
MNKYLLFSMGSMFLGVALFVLSGRWNLRTRGADHLSLPEKSWPPISVIVPATGSDPAMAAAIRALVSQDYPAFELLFVTRGMDDPAAAVISREIRDYPFARHACGGRAAACGQKNHNLLAGVREADAACRILVFCDCGHLAPPGWLKTLVAPIVLRQVEVTTAYHHVIPKDRRLATVGRAVNVLGMYLTQGMPWLTEPWGGAAAFERSVFRELRVAELWAGNVVDDISLVKPLRQAGIKAFLVPAACLSTPLRNETMSGWSGWFIRQLLFLKFCLPVSWAAAGIVLYFMAALLVLSAIQCIAWLLGLIPAANVFLSLAFLAAVGGAGAFLRTFHPAPGSRWRWLISVFVTLTVIAWCHFRTLLVQEIHWRGITYRVTWKGRVKGIRGN